MEGINSDKVNIHVGGGGEGGSGGAGLAAVIAALGNRNEGGDTAGLIAALGNRNNDGGMAAMLPALMAQNGNNGMQNMWPIILLALLGRGRGGLLGGDDGGCAPGGVGPGHAALLQTILETAGATRAAVPTTALETQGAIQQAISALALGGQQGFANVKDSVQAGLLASLAASSGVKDSVQNGFTLNGRDLAAINQNVSAQGCQTREAVAASTTAILSRIDRSEIDELRDSRNRFERQVEVNALRSQVEVNQTVNTTQTQAQAQAQAQLQFQDVNSQLRRICDVLAGVHQEQRSTNANIIAGNTGAVVTGPQTSTPTNVNAR